MKIPSGIFLSALSLAIIACQSNEPVTLEGVRIIRQPREAGSPPSEELVGRQSARSSNQEARIPESVAASIYRSQRSGSTCWAACNSMLLAADGIDSPEIDQLGRMSRIMPDAGINGAGAHFGNASQALRGQYGARFVQPYFVDRRFQNNPDMNRQLISILEQGKPVMIATPQHGMVAIAVQYHQHSNGYHEISAIEVLDPMPHVGRRWLPHQEAMAIFGFMSVSRP